MYYSLFLFLFSFLDRLSKCIIFKPQRKLKALGLFLRPFLKCVNICCIRFEKNLDKEGFDKQKTIISYAKLFRDEIIQLVMLAGFNGI